MGTSRRTRPIDHRSGSIMEHSGSGWPGNVSSGSLPGSGILPLQLKAKLLGVLFVDAVTSLVWGTQSVYNFPIRNYSISPRDKEILIFSHFYNYLSNV